MKIVSLIFIVLIFAGCSNKPLFSPQKNVVDTSKTITKPVSDTLTYLALGDSYTAGIGAPVNQSYPFVVTSSLDSDAFIVPTPTVIASSGWTSGQLASAVSAENNTFSFVTILIGVNDENQKISTTEYRINFTQILNKAIQLANYNAGRVFVISIPDWGVTPFANGQDVVIGPQIDLFNDINQSTTNSLAANYIDITSISRQNASDLSLYAEDGLHPSAKEYALWAAKIAPIIAKKLKQ